MVYVGMDVHRKRTQLAVVDDAGEEVFNRNFSHAAGELQKTLAGLEAGTSVALEAAYGWGWVTDLLEDLGLEAHLAHPSNCKAIASARLKNDKVDARTLAHLLRADLLPEAWIAPREVRELRQLVRHRAMLVRQSTGLKNRIHAVLADHGVILDGAHRSIWSGPGRSVLADIELPAASRVTVDHCCVVIDEIRSLVDELTKELRGLAKKDARIVRLKTVPGIGDIVATTVVAEIGDISRFGSARKLCSWAGLVPAVRASDRKVHHGHITKQGSTWLRHAMVEAAQVAKTRPPYIGPYRAIAHRRGNHIATVAIARKLLARCFYVLRDEQ
ncbi:MAG: IS110 family transposase [Actinomycetota bacterium]|nr:IS110 family transposase [Actinomycetota bacterium]